MVFNQLGVTELLIMRGTHYGRMCFRSGKTLGALHSRLWERPQPSASPFYTAENVELLGLYPIRRDLPTDTGFGRRLKPDRHDAICHINYVL